MTPPPSPVLPRTLAADLSTYADRPGTPVRIDGWVHRRRRLSGLAFVVIRDRSGTAQVVVRDEATLAALDGLPEETTVEVTGTTSTNPQAPGGVEVVDPQLTALTDAAATPPIELWRPKITAGLPTMLDAAPVTWRHPRQQARWHLAAASLHGFRSTLDAAGFTEVHSPKIVESATESGASVFEIDYFGRPAYLAQSPQFYKQVLVGVFERVYEVGPVFTRRAARHRAAPGGVRLARRRARVHRRPPGRGRCSSCRGGGDGRQHPRQSRIGRAAARHRGAGRARGVPVAALPGALEIAGAPADEPDLSPAHERAVGAWAREVHGSDFVVVEGYPTAHRAFYSHPEPANPDWSRSFDLIFRGVELVSGAQRLHRYGDYVQALRARGLPLEPYAAYIDAFKSGIPPHGGFAIGLERWTGRLVGVDNIREVTLFPRDLHRLAP